MNFSFNQKIFKYISTDPVFVSRSNITFIYRRIGGQSSLGFILPRSLGTACKRNKFKRLCREAFLSISKKNSILPVGLIVKPKHLNHNFNQILKTFIALDLQKK